MDAGGYSGQQWNLNRRISKEYISADVSGRESLELGVRGELGHIRTGMLSAQIETFLPENKGMGILTTC